ncbi:hypothetical protein ACQ3I4_03440 [Zafaria sp. Z1313]|uniref:hypothetical protein n=1 Tax=unclassified Zafaria TaxID=2828765 RepID=UPI002E77FF5F|nr:hypothetical protein [Zafaria sp. J156]MEE1622173.1 hypothetical protein [Zafaria sp. J156]
MSRRDARPPSPSGEEGQTMILVIGYVVIALLTISAMLAATAVNLEARRLLSVADGAATAAADDFSLDPSAEDVSLRLSDAAVESTVRGYLTDTRAAARFRGLGIGAAEAHGDGTTAYVRLTAVADPPIVGWFVPGGVPITVESSSRSVLSR